MLKLGDLLEVLHPAARHSLSKSDTSQLIVARLRVVKSIESKLLFLIIILVLEVHQKLSIIAVILLFEVADLVTNALVLHLRGHHGGLRVVMQTINRQILFHSSDVIINNMNEFVYHCLEAGHDIVNLCGDYLAIRTWFNQARLDGLNTIKTLIDLFYGLITFDWV